MSKTQEELTETRDAAVVLGFLKDLSEGGFRCNTSITKAVALLKDGIGDTTITLILAAEMAGLDYEECVQAAYDVIKGRTGKVEGGVFIKDKP